MNDQQQARLLFSKNSKLKDTVSLKSLDVRNNVLMNYREILFLDDAFAKSNDIEQTMWKVCFYKLINDYRMMIQQNSVKKPNYICFIKDSIAFYHQLQVDQKSKGFSVYKTLVFLGDLERYYAAVEKRSYDQSREYYCLAIQIDPEQGWAHNQLAVLATLDGLFMEALYRNIRSISCKNSYDVSNQNMQSLLKANSSIWSTFLMYWYGKEYLKDKFEKLGPIQNKLLQQGSVSDWKDTVIMISIMSDAVSMNLEPFIDLCEAYFLNIKDLAVANAALQCLIHHEIACEEIYDHFRSWNISQGKNYQVVLPEEVELSGFRFFPVVHPPKMWSKDEVLLDQRKYVFHELMNTYSGYFEEDEEIHIQIQAPVKNDKISQPVEQSSPNPSLKSPQMTSFLYTNSIWKNDEEEEEEQLWVMPTPKSSNVIENPFR